MKKLSLFAAVLFATVAANAQYTYPATRKVDTVDNYFGTKVADPYRWLEDDKSTETAGWVKAQNRVTDDYLGKISYRQQVKDRLTKIWNFEKLSTPFKKGKNYFYSRNDGIQNQSVFYVKEGLKGTPRVLIDPNTLSADGTISLNGISISQDGKYMAYGLSKAGSDWVEYSVMEIATGKNLSDKIEWVKFSGIAWKGDGFYYSRYDAPADGHDYSSQNSNNKLYFHKIGDLQSKDELIYKDSLHPDRSFSPQVSDDGKWLVIWAFESTSGNALMLKDLSKAGSKITDVITHFENDFEVQDVIKDALIVRTNYMASNYRLLSMPAATAADATTWTEIIPQDKNLLEGVTLAGGNIVARYLADVKTQMTVFNMVGKKQYDITMPGIVHCTEMSGDMKENEIFYNVTSFTAPPSVYRYDLNSKLSELYMRPKIDFASDNFETHQVFIETHDGTRIPMFITYKKGTVLDGNAPCFLFGYGGFNVVYGPEFRIDRAVFLEQGGIYAVANLRGGGEYGEDWHKAGTKCQKQNVFDDFIAAAEYLCQNKYTNKNKLAIHGRSNGGLLIGAVMTQRPDLCKVAIPQVGVLDMLRYHKFTIGRNWSTDYGLSENKTEFDCLFKYSPLHNVKAASYPATLVLTGDHDDRVVPAHSFKYTATLQAAQKGSEPVMIRIDTSAGHGSGKPTAKQIEEYGDMWSFVMFNLGMKYK